MAQPTNTVTELIELFELQVNDVTELATAEEISILNRVYQYICSLRAWTFLLKTASGTMSSDSEGYYITIPTDFAYFIENNQWTDNTVGVQNNAAPKVVFVGTRYQPYQIVNFQDRRQYRQGGFYCYHNPIQGKIRFPVAPQEFTYEFDYAKVPPVLTASDTPLIPGQFQNVLVFGMAVENDILQLSEKARSYQPENERKYAQHLENMDFWQAEQYLN